MKEKKSQCDGEREVLANFEELKERFHMLANFFGFTTQIQTSNICGIITMEQNQGNKYISYQRSGNNAVNDIKIGIRSDNQYDNDMYFEIEYDDSSCRLCLHIPTIEMYSEIWHYKIKDGCPPCIHRDSYIDIDMNHCSYKSQVYGGRVILTKENYIEERPVVGEFSLPADISQYYENHGYELCRKPGPGGFYKKELEFPPERSQEFIRNILQNSKYLPCLIATLFQKLGCTETCDASEIFRLMVSLLPQQFVTGFFGDEETYQNFLTRLKPEKNIRDVLAQLQNEIDTGIEVFEGLISERHSTPDASTGRGAMRMNPIIQNGQKPNNP